MNRTSKRISIVVSVIVALVLLCVVRARAQSNAADLYKAKCVACHGADGKGDTPAGKALGAHDFASAEVQKETDDQLIEITANGRNKMPAYGKSLKASEIKDLVAYIRGLAKRK